jgi:NAD(P)-dependent dehydrogenase (short-subunit alcohol dehydrogenase family)
MEVRDWDLQIDTNLKASFLLTRHFVEEMKRNKQGKFIFINSVAGQYGHSFSNSTAYVASKYGLKGFADTLRTELREFNIKVTSVYPGAIDTNFWNSINVEFPRDEMLSVEDLAETILHTIEAPNSSVIEDVVVRRTAGDF